MSKPGIELPSWSGEYQALRQRAGLVTLGHRTQLELTGSDRASFLHNLCTNEVRKLLPGQGNEAFITTVQGKTLGHGWIFAGDAAHWIDTVPGQAATLLAHLDHYLVCEQVTLRDASGERAELLLAGPEASRILQALNIDPPAARLAHVTATIATKQVRIARVDLTGDDGFLISVLEEDLAEIRALLLAMGAVDCSQAAFEAARIEQGFPWFGRDMTADNLPQELARDAQAISFVKGCYLGQETVARIDALGHVNKTLVGVRFDSAAVPADGTSLTANGQTIGHVTSASYSPRLSAPLALAWARRGFNTPGTRFESPCGAAEVVALPLG